MEPTRARFLTRITLAIAMTFAVSAPAFVASDARAQLVTPEDRCQADLAKTSRKYLERVLKYRIRCQNKVITGDLPLATDCLFGMGDEVLEKQLLKTQARLSVSGTACNGVNLALLGFPLLCDDETGGPFDTADFKECVLERTEAILDELLDYYYPPLFERQRGDIALCLQGTPQDAMDSLIGKIRAREKCLVGQAYGKIDEESVDCHEKILPYGSGTGDQKTDDALSRAYVELLGTIPKACAVTNINELDYQDKCGDPTGGSFNIFDLKNCLFNADRVAALEALGTVFPVDGICGDGTRQSDEECDNGQANSNTAPNACRLDCTNPDCGDGVTDTVNSEQCDDGNSVNNDCCLNTCVAATCGDGAINCGETCDNGASNSNTTPDACRASGPNACKPASCGDGVQDSNEECDDNNKTSEDGCSSLCLDEFCGDEIIQDGLGEECDDGVDNGTGPDQCRPQGHPHECRNPFCGDTIIDSGEECDDGGTASGDGCDSTCQTEGRCGDGEVLPPEECDDGDSLNSDTTPDACRTNCQDPGCPDGVIDTGESCDDGNTNNSDGCSNACGRCGDAIVQAPEECDDGDTLNSDTTPDACRDDCTDPSCGDGVTDPSNSESCDDGNTNNADACNNDCGSCGDGLKQPSEECDGSNDNCPGGVCLEDSCTCELACPTEGELILWAGIGQSCSNNADCPVGTCESDSRCHTSTRLDSGWTGVAHNADINDQVVTRGFLDCSDSHGPVCGECNVAGIDPSSGSCRCANDIRNECDQPFVADADDCGGAVCDCYLGAPFPLSSGGTPACVLNRFSQNVTGTANVDLGAGSITANLRAQVFLGGSTRSPCNPCGGKCSNNASVFCHRDEDCSGGTCTLDTEPGDGVRGGFCTSGDVAGQTCDPMGYNSSFPAYRSTDGDGGGWYSLDCPPDVGKNISGAGLIIGLTQTTGTAQLAANVPCVGFASELNCHCLQCSGDSAVPCNTDAECASMLGSCNLSLSRKCSTNAECTNVSAGNCNQSIKKCQQATSIACNVNSDCASVPVGPCRPSTCSVKGGNSATEPLPNGCIDFLCTDLGGGEGECTIGPDSRYCDAILKANGGGILSCLSDEDCDPGVVGVDAGQCTLTERAKCLLDPITITGDADPETPIGVATFCIPPTSNSGINTVAGLPGPGRIRNQATSRTFCGNDTSKQYIPGVGGCVD
jgi:cysteine-rich repeat protein